MKPLGAKRYILFGCDWCTSVSAHTNNRTQAVYDSMTSGVNVNNLYSVLPILYKSYNYVDNIPYYDVSTEYSVCRDVHVPYTNRKTGKNHEFQNNISGHEKAREFCYFGGQFSWKTM